MISAILALIHFCLGFVASWHVEVAELPMVLQDLISQLLTRNAAERLGSKAGAEEIKNHPFFENIKWALIRHTTPPFVPKRTNAAGASSPAQKNDNFSTF